jgi:hypothetical protein
LGAVQCGDSFLSVFRIGHFHETEAPRAAGIAVGHNADTVYLSVGLEQLPQLIFRSVEVEVPNKDVLQANCLCLSYLSVLDFGAKQRLVGLAEKPELANIQMRGEYSRSWVYGK